MTTEEIHYKCIYEYYELPGELVDIQPLGNGQLIKPIKHIHMKNEENNMF